MAAAMECTLEIPKVEGLTDSEMTVGREAQLLCSGSLPQDFDISKLQFVQTPENKYDIRLLESQGTANKLSLKITGYRAGEMRWSDLQITDGKQTASLGPVQYHVESVLPKPAPGAQQQQQAVPEAYGPIGPASIAIPSSYWIILAAVLMTVALFIIFKIVRAAQRRRIRERLKEHDSALSPLHQFHQSARHLQRTSPIFFSETANAEDLHSTLSEVHKMLQLFLTRKYRVPAFEWSARLILREVRKYHRAAYDQHGKDLKDLLNEFQHAFANKEKISQSDVVNITKRTRTLVEHLESLP